VPARGWRPGHRVLRILVGASLVVVAGLGPTACGGHSPAPPGTTPAATPTPRDVVVAGTPHHGGRHQTLNCFSSPGACGFPDPAYGNVGVAPGTRLSRSGTLVITTPGTVINHLDVSGSIEVHANNVTIENTRVALADGGCGGTTPCGSSDIRIDAGVSGTRLRNLELTNMPGVTVQHAVYNYGSDTTTVATRLYVHSVTASGGGTDSMWWGPGTIRSSYAVAGLHISTDHIEDIYEFAGGVLEVDHDTLLNPVPQTATVFVDGKSGDPSKVTVTDSLLAGGGFTLYTAANGGRGQATITDNHFARCLTPAAEGTGGTWQCHDGPDSHGYFPKAGSFGATTSSAPDITWSGDVWDDNGEAVTAP
jgi:hypothetical protein